MKTERLTSSEWKKKLNIDILSYAGWDINDFHKSYFEEEITEKEFESRLNKGSYMRDGKLSRTL